MSKRIEDIDQNFQSKPIKVENGIEWHSPKEAPFAVDGLAWFKEDKEFIRLPKRAKGSVREDLWILGTMPSGGCVRFKTDSTVIHVRMQHAGGQLAMPHMTSVGVSGLDLYEGPPSKMTFWNCVRPGAMSDPYTSVAINNLSKKMREFTLYLPTYNALALLEIGFEPGAKLSAPTPYKRKKPVVFYGTSVTQGGCSTRPGSGFVPMIGRNLGVEAINLGFSGNGICDPELIPLLSEINTDCLVIDCVFNMGFERMQKNYANFVGAIRKNRPKMPMLLVTAFRTSSEFYTDKPIWDGCNEVVLKTYREIRKAGDKNIHYYDSRKAIGMEHDHPSVDGIHLNDWGFHLLAKGMTPAIKKLLK